MTFNGLLNCFVYGSNLSQFLSTLFISFPSSFEEVIKWSPKLCQERQKTNELCYTELTDIS